MIKKELNIYGDNIVECFKFVENIQQTFEIQNSIFSEKSNFLIPQIIIENDKYKFILNLFPNYDKWKKNPIDYIRENFNAKLNEYPDVIVFEKKKDKELLLFAIEYSNALLAGNQAWQRQGRCFSFAEAGINFFYVIELGGKELDANRNEKTIRFPNPVVILSYLNFLDKFKKNFYPIFSLNSNSSNEFRDQYNDIANIQDFRNCLFDIIIENKVKQKNREIIIDKSKKYFHKLYQQANNINKYKNIELLFQEKKNTYDFFSTNKFDWKKSISIPTTQTLKKLKKVSEKYGISIISKNLPFVLIPNKKKIDFIKDLKKIYNLKQKEISKIKQKENLILCFILGFKPRGDDARPDRGLNPLIKMIFNNQASIFSIIYGPATLSLWNILNSNTNKAKETNGLIKSIMEISDILLVDSVNYPNNFNKVFFKKDQVKQKKNEKFNSVFYTNKFNEHDIDNSIFLFFKYFCKNNFFESMINPPGGDWSNVDFIDDKMNIYRWTNLPRVSGANTKRPDHIYIFDSNKNKIALIIESKFKQLDLEENIGARLVKYVNNLISYKPNCIKKYNEKEFFHNKDISYEKKIIFKSSVAYYALNKSSTKEILQRMKYFKTSGIFEIYYDKNYKIILNYFTNDTEIFDEFKKLTKNNPQVNFSVIKI
ncbi:hypothetical protein OAY90_01770 [Candidatus Pelagibacter sp.]|nr:hypothetical protein [Candidatus Pelagibacter sp.]